VSVIPQDLNPSDTASLTYVLSSSGTENHWQLLPSNCKLSSLLYVSLLNLFQQWDLDTLIVQMMCFCQHMQHMQWLLKHSFIISPWSVSSH
jgi:hypothetical protein